MLAIGFLIIGIVYSFYNAFGYDFDEKMKREYLKPKDEDEST